MELTCLQSPGLLVFLCRASIQHRVYDDSKLLLLYLPLLVCVLIITCLAFTDSVFMPVCEFFISHFAVLLSQFVHLLVWFESQTRKCALVPVGLLRAMFS